MSHTPPVTPAHAITPSRWNRPQRTIPAERTQGRATFEVRRAVTVRGLEAVGPFMMNTPDDFERAFADYHAGRIGRPRRQP